MFYPALEPTVHPTLEMVAIQRVSLDELATSAAARSQTFIVLQQELNGADITTITEDMSSALIVATHLSALPLTILLLSTATHLQCMKWKGAGFYVTHSVL